MVETNNNQSEELEIDLREIFLLLLSKLWLIILVGILTASIAFGLSAFLIKPSYDSTTKIYILNRQDENTLTYSDVQLGTQLTKDYAQLITGRLVLEKVIEELGLSGMAYEDMLGKVSVATPTDTRILSITVSDRDPVLAMNIANSIRENAAVHIKNVMDIEAVNVAETANLPTQKAGPSVAKWVLAGGSLGALLVIAVILLIYFLDDTIKTSDDVEKYLGLSTLALIPSNTQSKKK
ncbi:MAG: protein-tyrosine kinase [Lachnospiraceae bacterium]|nr:protein-tyrosine kinase [Lachnospiraceae bacterium]